MLDCSEEFRKEAINLALSRVRIMQCQHCSHPVVAGFCCPHCGSGNPTDCNQDEVFVEV